MSDRSTDRAAARGRQLRQLTVVGAITAFVAVVALGANAWSKGDRPGSPSRSRTVQGPAQALGQGTARVYAMLDRSGRPTSLGVALSEGALRDLPEVPMPGKPSAAMLMLALPAEARVTGFDHVMLDWNPAGHEPEHVYTLPHFDFHFYSITEAEQMAIVPTNPQFEERASKIPGGDFVPEGYVSAHAAMRVPPAAATVPAMGLHWIDRQAPELNGQSFTTTFIYGSYDGRVIFYEPMITKAYIESAKTVAGNAIVSPVKLPAKFERSGFYPTQYSIAWDSAAKEYRIALDRLVPRG